MKVNGKLVLVTGAARGIGLAIARAFAEADARVILTDLPSSSVADSAKLLANEGHSAYSEYLEVTDRADLSKLVDRVAEKYGDIDVLVNNAGIAQVAPMESEHSPDIWDRTINVNLNGVFNVTHAFLGQLTRTQGAVVNLSSVCAYTSSLSHVSYTASKGGVTALTIAMCREFAPLGIRVNAVAPGWTETEMVDPSNETQNQFVAWHVPFKRYGTPAEIAAPVVFLASSSASFISGVTLPVDGGFLTV